MLSAAEMQLSITHADTDATNRIACCDLGHGQSTSELSLVQHSHCHRSHGSVNSTFHIRIPRKWYCRSVDSLKICQAIGKNIFILLFPTKWIVKYLFDSNRWFSLYLIGKVTLDIFFLHCSNPILLLWITFVSISYIYQWNFHLSDFCWGEEERS